MTSVIRLVLLGSALVGTILIDGPLVSAAPGLVHLTHATDYYDSPNYAYNYGVHDPHTGDVKEQREERNGDVVKGQYSLVEPDGSIRRVDYTADPVNGFNAVVSKTPAVHPVTPVKSSAVLLAKAAPVVIAKSPTIINAAEPDYSSNYALAPSQVAASHYETDYDDVGSSLYASPYHLPPSSPYVHNYVDHGFAIPHHHYEYYY